MNDYLGYCFAEQDNVLALGSMSRDDFQVSWSKQVAAHFGYKQDELYGIYDRATDKHDTEDKTRAIWKYGASRGVSGTPTAYVNGAKLDDVPNSAEEWITLLNTVYASQWGNSSAQFLQ